LFQGEEWGARTPFLYFTDHEDVELGRLVAEGRSQEFSSFRWQGAVPNPQELETFTRSKLNWSELAEAPHAQIYEWYRQLTRLRRGKRGRAKAIVKFDAKAGSLRFVHDDVLCVFNFSAKSQRLRMPHGEWDLALRSDMTEVKAAEDVPAQATLIYRRRG
jgi:maltooligosyltrehalose trehalohydrolase